MTEYERETDRVIPIVNRGHGPGGELPGHAISYIPADRAERVCELDARIQEMKRVWPVGIRLVICLAIIMAVSVGWVHPVIGGCMVFVYLLQTFFAWRGMRSGEDHV